MKPILDQRGNQVSHRPPILENLSDQAGTDVVVGLRGAQENRFEARLELAVHDGHLKFVLIVGEGANAAQYNPCLLLLGVIYEQTSEGLHRDIGHFARSFLEHLATFPDREKRRLVLVRQNRDNQLSKNPPRSLDEVEMTIGDRIERTGING